MSGDCAKGRICRQQILGVGLEKHGDGDEYVRVGTFEVDPTVYANRDESIRAGPFDLKADRDFFANYEQKVVTMV